jgi:DNA-binding MarR family transcriptional regulator
VRDYEAAFDRTLELAVLLNEDMDSSLARDGLTRSRAHVLWELHQRGPVTQRVLAGALAVSARNITGLVDALVATGFVTREPHPRDRRATLVTLTATGAAAAEEMDRGRRDLAHALFSGMPREQFDGYAEGLDAVLTRLGELIRESRG